MVLQQIKHNDSTGWAVASRVDQAPACMVIRELLQNALEGSPPRERVEFGQRLINGIPKLFIRNYGVSMSPAKLEKVMNINASGEEKQQGKYANYGIGAKLVGLKASPAGLIYLVNRRNEDGEFELISCVLTSEESSLGHKVYGLHLETIDGSQVPVWIDEEEYDHISSKARTTEFVEVTLLGTSHEQNTVEPFCSMSEFGIAGNVRAYWLIQSINRRFYDLSSHTVSVLGAGNESRRIARGLSYVDRLITGGNITEIKDESRNCTLRYIAFSSAADDDRAKGFSPHVAIVWRGEVYCGRWMRAWTTSCGSFDMPFIGDKCSVQIMLPDDYPIKPDTYRRRLLDSDDQEVSVLDFAEAVKENRPAWVKELVALNAPDPAELSEENRRRLQRLLRQIDRQSERLKKSKAGFPAEPVSAVSSAMPELEFPPSLERRTKKKKRKKLPLRRKASGTPAQPSDPLSMVPSWKWDSLGAMADATEHSGKAAVYDIESNTGYINQDFELFQDVLSDAKQMCEGFRHDEKVDEYIWKYFREDVEYLLNEHVLCALQFERKPGWSRDNVERAVSPESLSTRFIRDEIVGRIVRMMNKHKQEIDVEVEAV